MRANVPPPNRLTPTELAYREAVSLNGYVFGSGPLPTGKIKAVSDKEWWREQIERQRQEVSKRK